MSAKSNQGLPLFKQKHLANLVEANGGREAFSKLEGQKLAKLLDNFPNYYGKRVDSLRRITSNKLYKWKSKSEADYLKVLNKLQVKSHSTRREENKNLDSPQSSESKEDTPLSSPSPSPSPPPPPSLRHLARNMSPSPTLPPKTTVIEFDEKNPECHPGLACVLKAKQVQGHDQRTFYDGFDIWLEVDPR